MLVCTFDDGLRVRVEVGACRKHLQADEIETQRCSLESNPDWGIFRRSLAELYGNKGISLKSRELAIMIMLNNFSRTVFGSLSIHKRRERSKIAMVKE
jgi:hypothetical protein